MRRPAPRPLSAALEPVTAAASPQTLLARVQSAWPEVAGRVLAAAASPMAERDRVVTVACESAAWAHELELMAPDLLARVNERVAVSGGSAGVAEPAPVSRLRFVVGSMPNRR